MEAGAKEGGMTEVYRYETQEEFWENGLSLIKEGDNVLVKASLSTGLSRTVDKLQGVN
jgi:UDP-N-acetylmuramoyl-tripeptide--D-alanyl-D-alanine ligase